MISQKAKESVEDKSNGRNKYKNDLHDLLYHNEMTNNTRYKLIEDPKVKKPQEFISRDTIAKFFALVFLGLVPFSFFVSKIIFLPLIAFYFLALSFQERGWVISQRWKDVVFLHYKVDPKELQKLVPFPLDLFEGEAIVSIVPFVMSRIRFPFLLPVPGLSQLLELNLRTYVIVNDRPAVYFFTLDSNHLPGVLIARWFFALPYRWVKLSFSFKRQYEFQSKEFLLKASVGELKEQSEFDRWSTERYALFTKRGLKTYQGTVEHEPWKLQALQVDELTDHFSSLLGEHLRMRTLVGTSYSQSLDVRFRPFKRL